MTEPQVWTLIGVFTAAVFGMQGILISSIRREMRAGFDRLESKIDAIDRDVQGILRREYGS